MLCKEFGLFCYDPSQVVVLAVAILLAAAIVFGVPIAVFASKMNRKDRDRERIRREKADLMK